ncbi:diguanylate cyclase [Nostoc sp. FACHB-87]|uniref:sensor domain-containing diguanylate cyclase n=1 Tax=Nostocales TaxID=1161 RepID=UPI0016861661|nr:MULTISPECIES: sensor domain-containing diguanylate cyclase [Nostocales]MBD2457631.1 diguanylate cyclase [Nostoc sp. FACHB-87]MBD2477474.1 diguanylate cyclase [Anabaena sp. FACHB-83]MBD2487682.1 diguanylate cyclase [Aulosira sp. FACHB-615]
MQRTFLGGIRSKLIASFLIVALIPLLLLSCINKQTTETALTENAKQALSAAAKETANRIDAFIDANLNAVRVEAILPGLSRYLSLTPKQRNNSQEMQLATETLSRLSRKDMLNILSYSLLDLNGKNVLDTHTSNIGKDESAADYFQQPLHTGLSFVSSMKRSPQIPDLVTLVFSSPVRNAKGKILGVLRVAYNATVVQQLVTRETERAGAKAFAILLDENHIYLAHSTAPELLFKSIVPLPLEVVTQLQKKSLLPNAPVEQLATNEWQLKQALDNQQSYLITSLSTTANQVNLIAIAHLKYEPWSVLFIRPLAIALAPVDKQITDAMLLFALIASVVTIIAIVISQLLTKPIIYLTKIVAQFTAGNLDIRAKINSQDEIGQLATSFNNMALQLQTSLTTLEQRVQERTAELVIAKEKAEDANQKLEKLINLDGLTQVANRRCLNIQLQAECHRLAREQQPLALILFDVDQFKLYNDCYGHLAGDNCLIKVAQTVQHILYRPADLVARYGGEEFLVLLPNTNLVGAITVAQRIQEAIHELAIPHEKSSVKNIITVSLGITSVIPTLDFKPDTFIALADLALYNAKKQGRDRYCSAEVGDSSQLHESG